MSAGRSAATIVSTHPIHEGRVVRLALERVTLPDGSTVELEIVRHPGGAAAVALDAAGNVCLLRHYRHAAGGWLLELPAGKLDPDEAPLATARRELAEEAGIEAGDWRPLGEVVPSPGVLAEVVHLFLARGLEAVGQRPEAGEVFEVVWTPLAEAVRLALDGSIRDAKTVIGLLRAAAVTGVTSLP